MPANNVSGGGFQKRPQPRPVRHNRKTLRIPATPESAPAATGDAAQIIERLYQKAHETSGACPSAMRTTHWSDACRN